MIRDDEEREVLRAAGIGTPRNANALISPLALEVDILAWCVPDAPIPMVLRCSFLFPFASTMRY